MNRHVRGNARHDRRDRLRVLADHRLDAGLAAEPANVEPITGLALALGL